MDNDNGHQATDPSTLLQASSLATYQDHISRVWKELYRLNSNLFILDKILKFRSDLFLEPLKMDFLNLVIISLTHDSCLIVTKLITDEGIDTLTMPRFHSWVRKNLRPEYVALYDESCKNAHFRKTIHAVRAKIKPLRDNYLAHLIINGQMRVPQETGIAFQELRSICDQLVNYFNLHSFGCEYKMLPLGYDPTVQHPVSVDKRSDIEYILDLRAQDSDLFKMPEKSPYWKIYKGTLPSETIEVINEYRRKFGKPIINSN
jgi:hypothetical protein